MTDAAWKRPTDALPIWALSFLPGLRTVAMDHGYALAIHGSLARDFDFVAIPWTRAPSSPRALMAAIASAVGGIAVPSRGPERKPHGRLAWSILLGTDGGMYIDLSVISPRPDDSPPARGTYDDDGA